MKLTNMLVAAGLVASLGMTASAATAQDPGKRVVHKTVVHRTVVKKTHHRQVCRTQIRHHHKVRVCR